MLSATPVTGAARYPLSATRKGGEPMVPRNASLLKSYTPGNPSGVGAGWHMQTGVLVSREISGVNTPGPEPWPQIEALLDTVPGVPERKQRLAAAQADPATLVHLCS